MGEELLIEYINNYMQAVANNRDENEAKISLNDEREIIVLVLIGYIINMSQDFNQEKLKKLYNLLADAFGNSSIIKIPSIAILFLKNFSQIFNYIDLEKIKSLRFCFNALQDSKYDSSQIFRTLAKRDFLHAVYDFMDIDWAYSTNKKYFLRYSADLHISSSFVTRVFEIIKLYFPTVLTDIILQYLVPSIFDKMSSKIEKWNRDSQTTDEIKIISLKQLVAIQQTPGSADCGYWALFNTFKLLTELPYASQTYFSHPKIPEEIKISTSAQFDQFKASVKDNLSTPQEDLTAVDLGDIFDQAAAGSDQQLRKLFPDLQKKLLMWSKGSGGIPAYTIVNSALVTGESKLESAFSFGGCLPGLKMQMAINFYHLAQFKDQRQLHCILIGTDGHWHVQLLATSYFSSGSINFFQVDSASVPVETLQVINSHLVDLLNNSEVYVQNVAEELISPIHSDLMKFSDMSKCLISFKELEEIQKHCDLLVKFFSVFGHLSLAKNYLPTLKLAKQISGYLCEKNFYEFQAVSQRLGDLGHSDSNRTITPSLSLE